MRRRRAISLAFSNLRPGKLLAPIGAEPTQLEEESHPSTDFNTEEFDEFRSNSPQGGPGTMDPTEGEPNGMTTIEDVADWAGN